MATFEDSELSPSSPEQSRAKPAALQWEDPFLLDQELSDEERMIRDSASSYAQDKLQVRVIDANRNEVFHREIMSDDQYCT